MKRCFWSLGSLVLGVACGQCHGLGFAAVDVAPNPDSIVEFDINSPSGADIDHSISLVGNFVRGMDMENEEEGWYMATAPLLGSPTGLFHLIGGVPNLVAPMPFLTTTDGGMALSQDHSFLWVALDPPDTRPYTLFRVSFTGIWTEVGPITDSLGGSPQITGLALNVDSGKLYGLDNSSDRILEINQTNGVGTRLPGPTGVSIDLLGGMDFSDDGELVFVTNGGNVYIYDFETSTATLKGTLPFNSSSLVSTEGLPNFGDSITLGQYIADPSGQQVSVEILDPGTSTVRSARQVAAGSYRVYTYQVGTFDITFKASHWLKRRVSNVELSNLGTDSVDVELTNGDIESDNEVNLADYSSLAAAFGSATGDENWNPNADLNGDSEVNLADYAILAGNFGLAGDE